MMNEFLPFSVFLGKSEFSIPFVILSGVEESYKI